MAEPEPESIALVQEPVEDGIELGEAQLSGSEPPPEHPLPPTGLKAAHLGASAPEPRPADAPSASAATSSQDR